MDRKYRKMIVQFDSTVVIDMDQLHKKAAHMFQLEVGQVAADMEWLAHHTEVPLEVGVLH